ncbi:MAG: hypothetical protein IJC51_04450, partial [Eggerthellaceae bacterium]|nr:hypothetical protein [Eggerthellaceae bacterium]
NGTTWGSTCIQATKMVEMKNTQPSIDAVNLWFYQYADDPNEVFEVTAGWKWPNGITFTSDEQDELDIIAGSVGTYCSESFANFVLGNLDVDDDAVWQKYLDDFKSYNVDRITEIRQGAYDRYLAR